MLYPVRTLFITVDSFGESACNKLKECLEAKFGSENLFGAFAFTSADQLSEGVRVLAIPDNNNQSARSPRINVNYSLPIRPYIVSALHSEAECRSVLTVARELKGLSEAYQPDIGRMTGIFSLWASADLRGINKTVLRLLNDYLESSNNFFRICYLVSNSNGIVNITKQQLIELVAMFVMASSVFGLDSSVQDSVGAIQRKNRYAGFGLVVRSCLHPGTMSYLGDELFRKVAQFMTEEFDGNVEVQYKGANPRTVLRLLGEDSIDEAEYDKRESVDLTECSNAERPQHEFPMTGHQDPTEFNEASNQRSQRLLQELNGFPRKAFLDEEGYRLLNILRYYDRCRKEISLATNVITTRIEKIKKRIVHLMAVLELYRPTPPEAGATTVVPGRPNPSSIIGATIGTILSVPILISLSASGTISDDRIILVAIVGLIVLGVLWVFALKKGPNQTKTIPGTPGEDRTEEFKEKLNKAKDLLKQHRINYSICAEAIQVINKSRMKILRIHNDLKSALSKSELLGSHQSGSYFVRDLLDEADSEKIIQEAAKSVGEFIREFLAEHDISTIDEGPIYSIENELREFCRKRFQYMESIGSILLKQVEESMDAKKFLQPLVDDSTPLWHVNADSERETLVALAGDKNTKLIDHFREVDPQIKPVYIDDPSTIFVAQIIYGKAFGYLS